MKITTNQKHFLKTVDKHLINDESIYNRSILCFYIDNPGKLPYSESDFTELMNKGSGATTFYKLTLEADTKSGYTTGEEDGLLKGLLLNDGSNLTNTGAATAIERIVATQSFTIRTRAIIPDDNWLRVFRLSKVPDRATLPDGTELVLVNENGTINREVYDDYEARYVKNFIIVSSKKYHDISGNLIWVDYNFKEIQRAEEKNWRTSFHTLRATPGEGPDPDPDKYTPGVGSIEINFTKKPLINNITISGTGNRRESNYETISPSEIKGDGWLGEKQWRLLLVKPLHIGVDKLSWVSPWVAEYNFAWRIASSTAGLIPSYYNPANFKTKPTGNGFAGFWADTQDERDDWSLQVIKQNMNKALQWGPTTPYDDTGRWNDLKGLLRQAYMSNGVSYDYPSSLVDYNILKDFEEVHQEWYTAAGGYKALYHPDFWVSPPIFVPSDNPTIPKVSLKRGKYTQPEASESYAQNSSCYWPLVVGVWRRVGLTSLYWRNTLAIAHYGLVANEYFFSGEFYTKFFSGSFQYQNQPFKIFSQTGDEKNIPFIIKDPLTTQNAFKVINEGGDNRDRYLVLVKDNQSYENSYFSSGDSSYDEAPLTFSVHRDSPDLFKQSIYLEDITFGIPSSGSSTTYENTSIWGSDGNIFADKNPSSFIQNALSEEYFDDLVDFSMTLNLPKNSQSYDGITYGNDGYKINQLRLGIYTRGDYTIDYFDTNHKLIKTEKVSGASGRTGRHTTTTFSY